MTDELFNNLVISPSLDAIQEFKIQKTMYPAEFGGKASALINVVTKSGSNSFHGSALEFVRNETFDAHNYFDDPGQADAGAPPESVRRQRRRPAEARPDLLLLQLRRAAGPQSADPDLLGAGRGASQRRLLGVRDGALRSADANRDGSCTPFAGNQIPAARISPVAQALLAKVPLPTSAGLVQNLLAVEDQVNPMNQFSLRVDHRLGASDTLYGRVSTYRVSDTQPFGTTSLNEALVPGFGRTVTTRSENVAMGYTHAFGSSWLNEIRFGYLNARGGQVSPNQGVDFAALSGLQGVTTDPRDMGYPQVSFGGLFSAIGDPTSFVSRENRSFELYDNVMLDRGDHH